jgi:hypothetical protein
LDLGSPEAVVSMFHFRLLELESELLAQELAKQEVPLTADCEELLAFLEVEIGMILGARAPKDWRGWLSYRRQNNSLVILRGQSYLEGGLFPKYRASFAESSGVEAAYEYERGFDVTPPQNLDHLLVNFRLGNPPSILVWYGENIAPYKLFFEAEATYAVEDRLKEAIAEGCIWILTKPKDLTLSEFLAKHQHNKS